MVQWRKRKKKDISDMTTNNYKDNREMLKLVTAGSVDDGKSTLIGRLLYDLNKIYDDQLEAVKKLDRINGQIDFSLLTDGLSAEREQKITIDVAYRYFTTSNRKFIIADVPGHEQYTRNMVTGASTANLAVILVDATKGLQIQTKRHLFLATLLGINHMVIIINKMDLIEYNHDAYEEIKNNIINFTAKLKIKDIEFIPISSLMGDMIVNRGEKMNWYGGHTLLSYLENLYITSDNDLINFRFPIQYVLRPKDGFRGYAGMIAGGHITPGEEVIILPSGEKSKIKSIIASSQEINMAHSPQSVVITLENEIDASRGDMIVRPNNLPEIHNEFEAMIFWMSDETLKQGDTYLLKHTTKIIRCTVNKLIYSIDVDTLERKYEQELNINDVGKTRLQTFEPIFYDFYEENKNTGSFILIDEFTGNTVGAGIIWHNIQKIDILSDTE